MMLWLIGDPEDMPLTKKREYKELDDVVEMRSIECMLRLQDIYARTELALNTS